MVKYTVIYKSTFFWLSYNGPVCCTFETFKPVFRNFLRDSRISDQIIEIPDDNLTFSAPDQANKRKISDVSFEKIPIGRN